RSGARAADDARRLQSEEQAREIARRFRLKYVDLRDPNVKIDYALIEQLPVDFLVRNQVVPLEADGGLQPFAVADPGNYELVDELEQKVGRRIEACVASPVALDEA